MKKALLLISLLSILLIGAGSRYTKLYRLMIINKSGMELALSLISEDGDYICYLRVPKGDRTFPAEITFTIVPGTYTLKPYYIEPWDPLYGYSCQDPGGKKLIAVRNIRITFTDCNYSPRDGAEPPCGSTTPGRLEFYIDLHQDRMLIPT